MLDYMQKQDAYRRKRLINSWEIRTMYNFLPTSKEDETTNLGCATVFIEILENAGVINI